MRWENQARHSIRCWNPSKEQFRCFAGHEVSSGDLGAARVHVGEIVKVKIAINNITDTFKNTLNEINW